MLANDNTLQGTPADIVRHAVLRVEWTASGGPVVGCHRPCRNLVATEHDVIRIHQSILQNQTLDMFYGDAVVPGKITSEMPGSRGARVFPD